MGETTYRLGDEDIGHTIPMNATEVAIWRTMAPMFDMDSLREYTQTLGFEVLGCAPVEPLGHGWFAPHVARFETWLAEGRHGEMAYMAARAGERVVPEQLLPGVRSAIVLWLPHRTPVQPRPPHGLGRVAAYAWGRDYHNVARKALRKLRRWFAEHAPTGQVYACVDTGPVLERAFGERAGVGWIGRSTMLIHQRFGTFGSLAVIFTTLDLPTADAAHPNRCGTCTDCVDLCPTGALDAGGLDARKCISYWTIEHRGIIPREIRTGLGEWVFGCDICQDVCPWNHRAPRADPALWRPKPEHAWPDLVSWLNMSADALEETLIGSPMRRARGQGLRRNALIVLANTGYRAALPEIERLVVEDPDPVIRATATWAARTLGSERIVALAAADADPRVRAEAE